MTMYQPDHDVVRWGLHLIDVCSLSNNTPETVTCYERDLSWTESVTEGFCNPPESSEENLSSYEVADGSGFSSATNHHYHDLPDPSGWHMNSGELSHGNDYQDYVPEMEDESGLYGELEKRLDQLVSIPHVPKINGEIPSADEATSDHERLLNRLQLYDLVELKILGDGNCQFRSLSDQIYRTPEHHKFVREQIVDQLKSKPELYDNYVPMAYDDYLNKMSKSGEWGDHVTLQAAADCYGFKIIVMTSFKDTCYIEILPRMEKSNRSKFVLRFMFVAAFIKFVLRFMFVAAFISYVLHLDLGLSLGGLLKHILRVILLSFWSEVHYNSIYPSEESPVVEDKKKKRWWRT